MQDIFTNTRRQWLPPGARGIYGGAVIAQCLASAQKTVPDDYLVHSCHCYFLLAGSDTVPILFHVERVRDGRSFATRTVQAKQKGRCIFTTTVSFVREGSAGKGQVHHATPLPEGVAPPPDNWDAEPDWARYGPLQSHRMEVTRLQDNTARPDERLARQWIRARGKMSPGAGHQSHLEALAYMSDSYFIGTVSRVHKLWRFPFQPEDVDGLPEETRKHVLELTEFEGMGKSLDDWKGRPQVGMIVSLDHSIYFHEPRRVKADEWMFVEMQSPWSGDGRGFVLQKVYASDGTLLASCVQEGVLRLAKNGEEKAGKL